MASARFTEKYWALAQPARTIEQARTMAARVVFMKAPFEVELGGPKVRSAASISSEHSILSGRAGRNLVVRPAGRGLRIWTWRSTRMSTLKLALHTWTLDTTPL